MSSRLHPGVALSALLAILLVLPSSTSTAGAAPVIEPDKPRPHLFYTADEIAAFAVAIESDPARIWYEQRVLPVAQAALDTGLYNGSNRGYLRAYFERLDEVALAALVDPDSLLRLELIEFGTDVLLSAANLYDSMQLADFWSPTAAPSAFALANLYDSIHPRLVQFERNAIENDLLGQMLQDAPAHAEFDEMANKGVIAHMAFGIVALALEDQNAFEIAYGTDPDNDPSFLWAIREGYGDDGIWIEPTQHYHQYTMDHVLAFALATHHGTAAGIAEVLETDPSLREIYVAHTGVAYPSLFIVPTGDSRWHRTARFIHGEVLNGLYPGNDAIEWVLTHAYAPTAINRASSPFAWDLVQVEDYGAPADFQPASAVYAESGAGFAVLRFGADRDQHYAFIDFASNHPNHDHRDKLSTYFAGHDRVPVTSTVRNDRDGYGHTIFQNTVVIDRSSQEPEEGELGRFAVTPRGMLQRIDAGAASAYSSTPVYERTLVMVEDAYILDLFTIARSGQHTYDWVQHRLDEPMFTGTGNFQPAGVGSGDGYGELTQVLAASANDSVVSIESSSIEHGGIRTVMIRESGDQVFQALAPGPGNESEHPLYILRRAALDGVQFAGVHALNAGDALLPAVSLATSLEAGGWESASYGVRIVTPEHDDDLLLQRGDPEPGGVSIGSHVMDGMAALVRRQGTTVRSACLVQGTFVSAADDTLIDTAGAVTDVESDGETVAMRDAVADFRIYAPDAIEVIVDGIAVPFLRQGDYVIEPTGAYNQPPVADPGGPYAGHPGELMHFDGDGSFDPEGQQLTFSWSFGDGSTGSGAAPTHVYVDADDYAASLTVHDGYLSSETAEFVVSITGTVDVSSAAIPAALPAVTRLYGATPNPFDSSTVIRFDLAAPGEDDGAGTAQGYGVVALGIYDASGRLIRPMLHAARNPGVHQLVWDGRTAAGKKAPNGVYFIRLVAPGGSETRKVLLAR